MTFTVNSYETDFYTGKTSDNRQVVLGLLCPHLVAYLFSPEGILLGREARLWNYPASSSAGETYNIYDDFFLNRLTEQIAQWQREIGFTPHSIHIDAFMDEENWVGIGYETNDEEDSNAVLSHDEEPPKKEVVFYWTKEYYLSEDGEVHST